MDTIIKGASSLAPATKELIEVQEALPLPEPESGGFPWCGVGIGVGAVVLAAIFAKLYKCTAKK